jgi:hypothetical protein
MHFIALDAKAWFNLPREPGRVAYAAQESWVQNETIRVSQSVYDFCTYLRCRRRIFSLGHNLTKFGITKVILSIVPNPKSGTQNESLVIVQCGLERDLALFEAGDHTEVGEKGLTLR